LIDVWARTTWIRAPSLDTGAVIAARKAAERPKDLTGFRLRGLTYLKRRRPD
jgi:hypothetical protein